MKSITWKQEVQAVLIGLVIANSLALVYLVYHTAHADASRPAQVVTTADSCAIQESKPVLVIELNGAGALAICNKVIAKSNGRYFAYYGTPAWNYSVMCAIPIRKVQYTVYDIVPIGVTPTARYSMTTVCSLLQSRHRLIGEGF